MVPPVSRLCPATCEAPLHAYTRQTIAQASRVICDILATNVGIVRKAYRGGEQIHHKRAALRRQRAANLRRVQEQGQTRTFATRNRAPIYAQAHCNSFLYRILTARAANSARISKERSAWSIINILAHLARMGTSVGDKAVLVLKARNK